MSLSTALLPDRRPGREPTQGSRPDPHHQPTEAPPLQTQPAPVLVTHTNTTTAPMRPSDAPPRDSEHQMVLGPDWAVLGRLRVVVARECCWFEHARSRRRCRRALCHRALWRRRGLQADRLGGCARRCASLSLLSRLLRARRRLAVTPRRRCGVSLPCSRTTASCQGGRDRLCVGGGGGVGSVADTFAPTERCSAETLPMLL